MVHHIRPIKTRTQTLRRENFVRGLQEQEACIQLSSSGKKWQQTLARTNDCRGHATLEPKSSPLPAMTMPATTFLLSNFYTSLRGIVWLVCPPARAQCLWYLHTRAVTGCKGKPSARGTSANLHVNMTCLQEGTKAQPEVF